MADSAKGEWMRFGFDRARQAGVWLRTLVGPRECVLLAGLVLLGYGAWRVYPPAGFVVSGGLLVWFTRPVRVDPAEEVRLLIARELDARARR